MGNTTIPIGVYAQVVTKENELNARSDAGENIDVDSPDIW